MTNKKVGILSQCYRRNYGGILQSYALFQTVKKLGYETEIIDFRYNAGSNLSIQQIATIIFNKFFKKKDVKSKPSIAPRKLPKEHVEAFMRFKGTYQKLSPMLDSKTIGRYVQKYDAIIVGSDQVWNDLEGRRLFYFFDFGMPYKGRKIAYAPCSIRTQVKGFAKRRLERKLKHIDAISVRDETTRNLVFSTAKINPLIVLDPTFLYDFSEFISTPIVKGDYIFTYILGGEISCGHHAVLEKIFEKYGKMRVVAAIIPDDSLEVEKFADEIKYNAAPNEWVNMIANAKFIYTDSFHGCVFAMKFHKPFFAYYKESRRASRLIDLSKTYSLDNIKSSGDDIVLADIDYKRVDCIVEKQREKSIEFLESSLPQLQ